MSPLIRTAVAHGVSMVGGAVALAAWTASHQVDIYAVWEQFNLIAREIGKFVALVTPLASAGYGIWKTTVKQRLADLAQAPEVKGIVARPDIAAAIDSSKVQPVAEALPAAAKAIP